MRTIYVKTRGAVGGASGQMGTKNCLTCQRFLLSLALMVLLVCQAKEVCRADQPSLRCIYDTWSGIFIERDGKPKEAEDHLKLNEPLLHIFRRDLRHYRATTNDLGNIHNYFGRYDKAMQLYELSAKTSRDMEDLWSEGIAIANMATVYHARGAYDEALSFYSRALEIAERFENVKVQGVIKGNLGAFYHNMGEYNKAAAYYREALDISKKVPGYKHQDTDVYGQGLNLGNLAILYRDWGDYKRALEYLVKALQVRIRAGDISGQGNTLADMAKVYQEWGQNKKALEYYEKAIAKKIEAKDKVGEGDMRIRMGAFLASIGQYHEAEQLLTEGMAIWQKRGIATERPEKLLAGIYLETGALDRVETIVKRVPDEGLRARLSLSKADYPNAVSHFKSMIQEAQHNRTVGDLFASYTGLGLAYESHGDVELAEKYYKEAVQLTEELRSSLEKDERDRFFDVKIGGFYRTAPYKGLARVLLKANRGYDAFCSSEFTKARVFSEAVSRRLAAPKISVPEEVLQADREINDQIISLKTNRLRAWENGDVVLATNLEAQIKNVEEKLDNHKKTLRAKYPVFAATRYPQPMELSQQALSDDEWVLVFDVSESAVLIFLLKGRELVYSELKPIRREELENLVRSFRKPLEVGSGATLREKLETFDFKAGKALTDLLLGDVLRYLPRGVSLMVVPDDCIGLIPLEALVLDDGGVVKFEDSKTLVSGTEFFGDRNQLVYAQSVTALTLARQAAVGKHVKEGMLVVADPVFELQDERAQSAQQIKVTQEDREYFENVMATIEDSTQRAFRLKRLPETLVLADSLSEMFGRNFHKMTGLEATKGNFLKFNEENENCCRWIVIATHGLFSNKIPELNEPFLVLTQVPPGADGFLRMSDVMSLNMSADLVALTACQTGLGSDLSGEGVMSMGRAFQYAGARSVLMSLWSVAEKSSVMLVGKFFKYLMEGTPKPLAHKMAREDVRKAGYNHPFFWAPFILVGDVN